MTDFRWRVEGADYLWRVGGVDRRWCKKEGREGDAFAPFGVAFGLVGFVFLGVGCWRRWMLGERVGDLVEIILGAVDADHGGILVAVVVVEVDGGDVLLGLHKEVDGLPQRTSRMEPSAPS
jgi:hypothetical protein